MLQFDRIAPAIDAIRVHILTHRATLPKAMAERLEPLTLTGAASPLDMAAQFVELVYANQRRKGVTKEARAIAAATARVFDLEGYHQRLMDRAAGIAAALSRENGEPGAWPDVSADPAPSDGYDIDAAPIGEAAPGAAQ